MSVNENKILLLSHNHLVAKCNGKHNSLERARSVILFSEYMMCWNILKIINLPKKENSMKTINSNPAIYELFIAKYYKAFDKIWYQKKDIIKVIFLKKDKIQNSLWKIILKIFNSQLEKHIDVILHLILPVFFLSKY